MRVLLLTIRAQADSMPVAAAVAVADAPADNSPILAVVPKVPFLMNSKMRAKKYVNLGGFHTVH